MTLTKQLPVSNLIKIISHPDYFKFNSDYVSLTEEYLKIFPSSIKKLHATNEFYLPHFLKDDPYNLFHFSTECLQHILSVIDDDMIKWCTERLLINLILKKDTHLFMHASPSIKNNNKIVYAIVKDCGLMLSHVSDNLKDNFDIVSTALRSNPETICVASQRIQNNPAIKCLIKKLQLLNDYQPAPFIESPPTVLPSPISLQ